MLRSGVLLRAHGASPASRYDLTHYRRATIMIVGKWLVDSVLPEFQHSITYSVATARRPSCPSRSVWDTVDPTLASAIAANRRSGARLSSFFWPK